MREVQVPSILRDLSPESDAAKLLRDYFTSEQRDGVPRFSGSRFESLTPNSTIETQAFEITAEDIVAVQCLGVGFTGNQVIEILEEKRRAINDLLLEPGMEPNATLWADSQAEVEAPSSPGNRLWDLLKTPRNNGIGPTRASKIMARKRPSLFPVYDKWVAEALKRKNAKRFWTTYRDLMLTDIDGAPLFQHLQRIAVEVSLPQEVTALRVCDVILWYSANRNLEDRRELILRRT